MARQNKIVKWNLEGKVKHLKDQGKSDSAIAKQISEEYSNVPELRNLSSMSVNRYWKSARKNEVENELEESNPTELVQKEFNLKMRENIEDAQKVKELADKYVEKLEMNPDNLKPSDFQKIIKSMKDANDQVRKDLVSMREFMENEVIRPVQQVTYEKKVEVRQDLRDFSHLLCPECKKKVLKYIKEEEE